MMIVAIRSHVLCVSSMPSARAATRACCAKYSGSSYRHDADSQTTNHAGLFGRCAGMSTSARSSLTHVRSPGYRRAGDEMQPGQDREIPHVALQTVEAPIFTCLAMHQTAIGDPRRSLLTRLPIGPLWTIRDS